MVSQGEAKTFSSREESTLSAVELKAAGLGYFLDAMVQDGDIKQELNIKNTGNQLRKVEHFAVLSIGESDSLARSV